MTVAAIRLMLSLDVKPIQIETRCLFCSLNSHKSDETRFLHDRFKPPVIRIKGSGNAAIILEERVTVVLKSASCPQSSQCIQAANTDHRQCGYGRIHSQ